jgi:hypothetical protein
MTAITGSDQYFTNIDSAFTATKWEACIDQAIDKINGYARTTLMSNMTGAAGSKTVTVTSMQAGFVRSIAIAIYANTKNAGASSKSQNLGQIGESSSSSTGGTSDNPDEIAKEAAYNLTSRSFRRA